MCVTDVNDDDVSETEITNKKTNICKWVLLGKTI